MSGGRPAPEPEYPPSVHVERDVAGWVFGITILVVLGAAVALFISDLP